MKINLRTDFVENMQNMSDLMDHNEATKVIVVLSPGRSGTSLLMNILGSFGMNLSKGMIPGRFENPDGYFEDSEIVKIQKQLLDDLNISPAIPLPENWLDSRAAKKARRKLNVILGDRVNEAIRIWGFKDPRTCTFMPLWAKIYNTAGVIPVFIVAVRDPASVAVSNKKHINREESISELQWLYRTCSALHHTGADCFIVHYEDWFERPLELAGEILNYTELNKTYSGDIGGTLDRIIKPHLNRSVYNDYSIRNSYVRDLYKSLKHCRGHSFERQDLMNCVQTCRSAMNEFIGWSIDAQKVKSQAKKSSENLVSDHELMKDLQAITQKYNDSLCEIKDTIDHVKELGIKVSAQRSENVELSDFNNKLLIDKQELKDKLAKRGSELRETLERVSEKDEKIDRIRKQRIALEKKYNKALKQLFIIQSTFSYQSAILVVDSIKKPGKNTLMFPFRLVRLIIESLFIKRFS